MGDRSWPAHILTMLGGILMLAYFWRARNRVAPVLDLRLFAIKTYRVGIVCGFISRAVSAGAFFFLLPMMLQVGFGFTPFQSGSVIFASAAGFLTVKFFIQKILRRLGFRRTLSINAIIGGLSIGMLALFLPTTPRIIMIVILFLGGLSRCLQYMALETLSYADIPLSAVSRASTAANVSKQFAIVVGVAFAALALQSIEAARGVFSVNMSNFQIAFMLVAIPAMATIFMILRMAPNAGAEVSGYQSAR